MRTLRAIYNHARKTNRELPAENPVNAIDWNGEERRDTAMGISDIKGWFIELAAIDNPIRREFHLFTLLSSCRPAALKEVEPSRVGFRRRMVHIPKPKGGAKRAFDIPLSREMIRWEMHPSTTLEWVFPADTATGHLVEQKVLAGGTDEQLNRMAGVSPSGQQQAVSSAMFAALGESLSKTPSLRDWLGPGATRRAIEKAKVDQSERAALHPAVHRRAA
jgi:hypothetical protein